MSDLDELFAKESEREKRLEAEVARLSKILGLVQTFKDEAGEAPIWLQKPLDVSPRQAVCCLQLSDLHLDEVVDPAEVNGRNAYSREIAEMRLRLWAHQACELAERYPHRWDGAVIFWGGDMVSGSIHEELTRTNAGHLPETMVYWAPRIAAAIRKVLEYFKQSVVYCVTGNHGRLTVKKQAKGRAKNSWDWLLSQMVAAYFEKDERVKFEIAGGSYMFCPIYGTNAYLTHGDEVDGGGGWAGVWSPLQTIHRKGLEMAMTEGRKVEYSVIGHWHQTTLAHHRGISCNGSMKGWDEYAVSKRLKAEAAMQNWWVHRPLDKHPVTLAAPLCLEDAKAEGWQ